MILRMVPVPGIEILYLGIFLIAANLQFIINCSHDLNG